jgi:hypothetical protein
MRSGRVGHVIAGCLVLAALATLGAVLAWRGIPGLVLRERCTASVGRTETALGPEQAANVATIVGVSLRRDLPERASVIALATAMQESKLRNLTYGDRDSLGLFQQRPSAGWGSEQQIMDPVASTEAFYAALVRVRGYQRMPVTVAAQRVQRSATPTAYAAHQEEAAVLAAALRGKEGTTISCAIQPSDRAREAMGPTGLTPRAEQVSRELDRTFGELPQGGFAPGGVSSGHMPGSAHYEGRAIDVFFKPVDATRRRSGRAAAGWAVTHAGRLGIATVIYDGKIWTARRSASGWRDYRPAGGDTTNVTLMHRDHVHIDVTGG